MRRAGRAGTRASSSASGATSRAAASSSGNTVMKAVAVRPTRPGWAANSRYSTVFLPPAPTAQRMPDSAPRACSRTSLMVRDHRGLDAENAGQEGGKAIPMLAVVAAGEQVAAGGAEVHPAGGQVVHIHGLAQHAHVGMGLRQACGQGLPAVAAVGGDRKSVAE